MAASEENSAMFPIFILTIMALPLVPYTFLMLCRAATKKAKVIHCQCAECSRSGKYRKSIFKRISNLSTCSNFTLVLLWAIMIFLVYYIKSISREGFQMGIALPQFLLDIDGASGGIFLLWIVGVCILLPLVIAVSYLSQGHQVHGKLCHASNTIYLKLI